MKKQIAIIAIMICAAFALAACGAGKFDASKNISVTAREDGSGTKTAFMEIIGLKGKTDPKGVIQQVGTAGILAEVKGNPYAIAYESLGYVTTNVKMLKIDGVMPSVENIKNGTYKIARALNVVYKESAMANDANKEFHTYLKSKQAQAIIAQEGYVSINESAVNYTNSQGPLSGKITLSGSTSLKPLMDVLAGEFEKIYANVSVEVAGGGTGTGYKNAENGTSDFGMISENFEQTKAPSCVYYEVAKDGIAVIVNNKNTLTNISSQELKNIYNSEESQGTKILTWNQITNAK